MNAPAVSRRRFLQRASLALAAAALPPAQAVLRVKGIIDTHTHFYDPSRAEGVPWPDKKSPLYRTVLPADWAAVARPLGVTGTVVVEASKWVEDNAWILALAERDKAIVGFVGNLAPEDPDFARHLQRFAAARVFRGIRVSGESFVERASTAAFREGIARLAEAGLSLDLNGPPKIQRAAAQLAADFPTLRIIIDHVGGVGDAARLTPEWRDGMRALGQHRNVWCKVSALIEQTEASRQKWGEAPRDPGYYAPIIDHCWECFGEDRLVYGSNWPVSEKGGSYADQFRVVESYFATKSAAVQEKFFRENSRAIYRWIERA